MRRFRNIPPLQYLLGFEAAARLESFSKAAEELGLSQSAISHEMRLLEERIGQPLFIRRGRTIHLTDAGRDYQRSVARSLEQLESGYKRLEPFRKPGSVIFYAPRDFASRWLLQRLPDLRITVPGCEPWIDTSGADIDFDEMEVSIAVVRARNADPRYQSQLLFADALVPVASPRLLPRPVSDARETLKYPLIHDERTEGWREWFEGAGIDAGDVSAGLDFSDCDLALQAAEEGYGIALASLPLVEDRLVRGTLVRVSPHVLQTGRNWLAVSSDRELSDPITLGAWKWLVSVVNTRQLT